MSFGNTNIKYTVYILNLMSHADLQALFIGFIVLSTGFASTHAFLKLKLSPCITIYFLSSSPNVSSWKAEIISAFLELST